jgi:hypothetical protein
MYRLKLRIRFVLSDKPAWQKRGFAMLTPPTAARRACPSGGANPFGFCFGGPPVFAQSAAPCEL